jgi:hypothetical protein
MKRHWWLIAAAAVLAALGVVGVSGFVLVEIQSANR